MSGKPHHIAKLEESCGNRQQQVGGDLHAETEALGEG